MAASIVRFLIMAVGAFDIGAIAVVIMIHWRAWRATRARGEGAGLLPLHVWVVSLAHGGFIGTMIWAMVEQTSAQQSTVNPRLWVYLACMVLTAVAIVLVGLSTRRRINVDKDDTTVIVRETRSIRVEGDA